MLEEHRSFVANSCCLGKGDQQVTERNELLASILDGLMRRYASRVPDVDKVIGIMKSAGLIASADDIENDHIAFRTLKANHLGIASLEKIFLHCGYQRRDSYHFKAKKLDAFWYAPPHPRFPRIFISELRIEELSAESQAILKSFTDSVVGDPVDALDLNDAAAVDTFLHQPLWQLPTWQQYSALLAESEYAAWVIYNRYYLNHFTISVHNLPSPYHSVEKFNELIESQGVRLNDAGGKVKTSPDQLLLQSSTVAQMVEAEFAADGAVEKHAIAGSYVEFAERRVLPKFAGISQDKITREHRRDGFEAGNADKIFESTFTEQTQRGDS